MKKGEVIMFDLSRSERMVVVFLLSGTLLGLGVRRLRLTRCPVVSPAVGVEERSAGGGKDKDGFPPRDPGLAQRSEKIKLNAAQEDKLETLPGIGPVLARRIVEYRSRKGSFQSLEELQQVKGIGAKKLEQIRPYLTLQ